MNFIYRPKGSMCIGCVHATRDCSGLDFRKMEVIETYSSTGYKVVRCDEYKKSETTKTF